MSEALACRSFPERAIEDAILLVSELVTNALMYGTGSIALACAIDGDIARIEVSDGDPTPPRAPTTAPDADEGTGRGLLIVDRVAARWGVDVGERGKTVWFELGR